MAELSGTSRVEAALVLLRRLVCCVDGDDMRRWQTC